MGLKAGRADGCEVLFREDHVACWRYACISLTPPHIIHHHRHHLLLRLCLAEWEQATVAGVSVCICGATTRVCQLHFWAVEVEGGEGE